MVDDTHLSAHVLAKVVDDGDADWPWARGGKLHGQERCKFVLVGRDVRPVCTGEGRCVSGLYGWVVWTEVGAERDVAFVEVAREEKELWGRIVSA